MNQFAMVFPGQGSQKVGMLSAMAERFPLFRNTFSEASEVLGYDLWKLVELGPEAELNQTYKTQPALLTASVALWHLWQQSGGSVPAVMAGHSLGEYSALVCAGALKFTDAVRLVELRGLLMQRAVPEGVGAMAAVIGLDDLAVDVACREVADGQVVAPANYNSPGQVVIAGHTDAVDRAGVACKVAGARRVLPLEVSVPSHCILMHPVAIELAQKLTDVAIQTPIIPVVNNVDVACPVEPDAIRDALVRQLYHPVQWTKTINFIAGRGITEFYESGPGKVLTGLTRRIVPEMTAIAMDDPANLCWQCLEKEFF